MPCAEVDRALLELRRQNPKVKSIGQLESDQCATEPPTAGDKFKSLLEIFYELSHEFEDPDEMCARIAGAGEFDGAVQATVPSILFVVGLTLLESFLSQMEAKSLLAATNFRA